MKLLCCFYTVLAVVNALAILWVVVSLTKSQKPSDQKAYPEVLSGVCLDKDHSQTD